MAQYLPIGEVMAYAGATAPTNFLLCDGASLLRADYAELFAVIGVTFGSADGTHFNVPNLKASVMAGWKSADSLFGTVGNSNGATTINLQHSHTQNAHTHTVSGTTGGPSASQIVYGGAGVMSDNSHGHTFSITSGAMSNSGTDNQLSSTQSTANPFLTVNFIIRHSITPSNAVFLYEIV